jgi:phage gpG-like protein
MRIVDQRANLLRRIVPAFRMSVYDTQRDATANAPVGKTRIGGDVRVSGVRNSPGALRQSIVSEFTSALRARVGSPLPYARIRDRGGTITARRVPRLVFQTYDGKWHSVRQVHQTGNAWLTRAGRAWGAHFVRRLRP